MELAESLYQRGFISYPRTETDSFKEGTDLQALIQIQAGDPRWGGYAQQLLDGAFVYPANGGHDDGAHPPIHPTKPPDGITHADERLAYEFIARHFLACCSQDALGQQTVVTAGLGLERFTSKGLMILQRNFLDIYPYDRWVEHPMPFFQRDQRVIPTELNMREGRTEPPPSLTESDLISLMDKNGIGTDATIAQHIKTILDRGYATHLNHVFQPTPLGLGLVEGYDALQFHMSQPTLRAHMERELGLVSRGLKSKDVVVHDTLLEMKRVFDEVQVKANVLDEHLEKYFPSSMAQRALQTIASNFTRCGACGNMTTLKQSAGQHPQRSIYCDTCEKSYALPGKHELQPANHTCPICQFQVVAVRNTDKNTTFHVCPYCFNHPPPDAIEDIGPALSSGMRCFQCARPDCALANKSITHAQTRPMPHACTLQVCSLTHFCTTCNVDSYALRSGRTSSDPVRACDQCASVMTLKTFPTGVFYLGCSKYPQCANKIVFTCKNVQNTTQECNTCAATNGLKPRLLSFTFSSGQAPPHISNPLVACVGGCDEEVNELFNISNRRPPPGPGPPTTTTSNTNRSRTTTANTTFTRPQQTTVNSLLPHPPASNYQAFRPRTGFAADGPVGFVNGDRIQPGYGQVAPPPPPADSRGRKGGGSGSTKKRGGRSSKSASSSSRTSRVDTEDFETSFTDSYRAQAQQGTRTGQQQTTNTMAPSTAAPAAPWHWTANQPATSTVPASITCYRCHTPGHYASACPTLGSSSGGSSGYGARTTSGGGGSGRGGSRTGRSNSGGGGGGGTSGECYHCHQPGHWASNCPNKSSR